MPSDMRLANSTEPAVPKSYCDHQQANGHVMWAKDNPNLFLAMRNPGVTRHADEVLKMAITSLAEKLLARVKATQNKGWNSHIEPETLCLQITSTIAGLSSYPMTSTA